MAIKIENDNPDFTLICKDCRRKISFSRSDIKPVSFEHRETGTDNSVHWYEGDGIVCPGCGYSNEAMTSPVFKLS